MANNPPRPGKDDRRAQAKAAADALRAKQVKEAARQRTIAIAALVVLIVVVGVAVTVILNNGKTPATAQVAPSVATGHGGVVFDSTGVVTPPSQTVTFGAAGLAADWPQKASFSGNPVVVSVYFDPMCPYCGLFEQSNGKLLDQLRSSGEIVIDSHPLSFLDRSSAGTEYSTRAANAAWTLAQDAPNAYFPFLEAIYAKGTQPAENSAGLTDAQLAKIALDAGAPQSVVDTFSKGTYRWWVAQATDDASKDLGSISTPTVMLNGVKLDPTTVNIYDPTTLQAAITKAKG